MSHFSVLVISRTAAGVGDALAPFSVHLLIDGRPSPYLVFKDETDLHRRHYNTGTDTRFRAPDGALYAP